MIIAIVSTALSIFCSICIGYALARLKFPGSDFMGIGIFLVYLVPPTLLFIPMAQVIGALQSFQYSLGLNSYLSNPINSFCFLAFDGLLPDNPQGD